MANFYKKSMTVDGRDYECISCKKERQARTLKISQQRKEEEFGMFISYTKGYGDHE